MNKIESICVFGDSISWGEWDIEKGGWANRLWLYVEEKIKGKIWIYNLGIPGGTTKTTLERFETEAKVREADGLIFQAGVNDSCLLGKDGPNTISLEDFRKNLEEIIGRAKNITPNIIFFGLWSVNEAKTKPVTWGDIYYVNEEIKKYDAVIKETCEKNSVLYLDIFDLLKNEELEDGLHPNTVGHEKIFEKAKDFLEENKWI